MNHQLSPRRPAPAFVPRCLPGGAGHFLDAQDAAGSSGGAVTLTAYWENAGGQQILGKLTVKNQDAWSILAKLNEEPGALLTREIGAITLTDGQGQFSYLNAVRAPFILRRHFYKDEVFAIATAMLSIG